MRYRLLILLTGLLCAVTSLADNILLSDVELKGGETKPLTVSLASSIGSCAGLQFDLVLPDGFSLETDANGIICTLAGGQPSDISLNVRSQYSGTYRFILYSGSLQSFSGGELLTVNLTASAYKEVGNYSLRLRNPIISDADGVVSKESNVWANATITESESSIVTSISAEPVNVEAGASGQLLLRLGDNTQNCAGIQFDLSLSEGFSLSESDSSVEYIISDNQADDMICNVKKQSEGQYRFMVYSNSLQLLKAGELLSVTINVVDTKQQGYYSQRIRNVKASNVDGYTVNINSAMIDINVTSGVASPVYASGLTMKQGEKSALNFSLVSDIRDCSGVQFDLYLPRGFSFVQDNDEIICTISSNQPSDAVCNIQKRDERTYRLMVYSTSLKELKDGELLTLQLKADRNRSTGEYALTLSNMMRSDIDGKVTKYNETSATILLEESAGYLVEFVTPEGEIIKTVIDIDVIDETSKTAVLTAVEIPASELGSSKIAIPAEVDGYAIVAIDNYVFGGMTNVSDIYLPDTEEHLALGEKALWISSDVIATIHTPLRLLADYALNSQLQQNFEAGKIESSVTAPHRYWTLSCGVDVVAPDGVTVYKAKYAEADRVQITPLTEAELTVNGKRVVKANNGVLIAGLNGIVYKIVASSGNQASGSTPATTNANSYEGNKLVPVIRSAHYAPSDYYMLYNGSFVIISSDDTSKTPACKALLMK